MTDHNLSRNIGDELGALDSRLAKLEIEQGRLLQRKQELLKQKKFQNQIPHLDSEQKVSLFRNLFRGRTGIFATRWQNSKGRSGYSVACHNEWIPEICNKPKVKCSECNNRQYKQFDEQVIYDHLAGKQVVGLYPLLGDNTCYLLAVDFDKTGWQDAVKAMAQICQQYVIPHAIEISRSGNGAHLWIFFSENVQAREARQLGFALLDKAMDIQPGLSFESYDRLLPNQDMMPEGGFGNLIALPLQHQARQHGNSQFVDGSLNPHPDQWEFLSQIKRLSAVDVRKFVEKLSPQLPEIIDERPPWEQGLKIEHSQIANCPDKITLILVNHMYVKFDELPAALATRLKRIASFSNPVFFRTQSLRFSTHGIPRFITCARIEQGYLSLPRGCFDEAVSLLEEQGINVDIDDKRNYGQPIKNLEFQGKLRRNQQKAITAITAHETGILHAPTAFGKTVTAIGIIAKRKVNTLILTHSRQLLDQWQERIGSFISGAEIGIYGGGKKKPTGQIDIATYQS